MSTRQIVLDTETTGLNPEEGHRIIEIGCIELIDRQITDNRFHIYLNPEREIDEGALEVHGINNKFLADKPHFKDIAQDFLNFIKESEVIIHNAPFDVGFLDHELTLIRENHKLLESFCTVVDTLTLARNKHPGQRNSLDALCKRYNIDNSHRELHGALLDAEILADVYLKMTGGQISLLFADNESNTSNNEASSTIKLKDRPKLRVIYCSEEEELAHQKRLDEINKASSGDCLWQR